MLQFYIVFVLCMSSMISFGQEKSYNRIFLSDGSFIQVEILEDTEYYIKAIIVTGDTLTIGYRNIVRIGFPQEGSPARNSKHHKLKGTYMALGYTPPYTGDTSDGGFGFEFKIGKRLNAKWNAGFQANYAWYTFSSGGAFFRPTYLTISPELRNYWTKRTDDLRWFSSVSLGVGIPVKGKVYTVDENHRTVIATSLSTGMHFISRNELKFLIEFGVKYLGAEGSGFGRRSGLGNERPFVEYKKNHIRPFLGFFVEI